MSNIPDDIIKGYKELDNIQIKEYIDRAAKTTRMYYLSLIAEGFSDNEALQLTISWQESWIMAGSKK